jgi:hypothetical protein
MTVTLDPIRSAPAFVATAVTPYFLRQDWLLSAINDIVEIGHLPTNWNSYNAPQLTTIAKGEALGLALNLSHIDLPEPVIAPVAGGGLQFVWSIGPKSLELEVMPDGAVEFLRVYANDTMREGRIDPGLADHITQQCRWLVEHQ